MKDDLVIANRLLYDLVIVMIVINALPVLMFTIIIFTMQNATITRLYSKVLNYKLVIQGLLYPMIIVKFNVSSFSVRYCDAYIEERDINRGMFVYFLNELHQEGVTINNGTHD